MRHANRFVPVVAAPLLVAGISGCLNRPQPQKSIEAFEGAQMSHSQLRNQVLQFMGYSARLISEAGQRIADSSSDRDVRYNSLLWRIYGVSELQSAGMRPNPVVGLIEVWTLSAQMRHLFERGDADEFFGEHQVIALETARSIEQRAVVLASSAVKEEDVENGIAGVENYVNNFPIEDLYFARWREPGETYMKFLDTSSGGTLASVATMEDRVTHLTTALPEMVKVTADIARWESELAVRDLLGRRTVGEILDEFESIAELARHADELAATERKAATEDLVTGLDKQLTSLTAAISAETQAITQAVDDQRRQIETMIQNERAAILVGVDEQREDTIELLREEREVILEAVDQTVDRALDRALDTVPERIDDGVDAFWLRAIQVGSVAFVLGGAVVFLALRYLVDRSRSAAA